MSLSVEKLTKMLSMDHKQVKESIPIDKDKIQWLLDKKMDYMSNLINPLKTEEGNGWVKQNLDFLYHARNKCRRKGDGFYFITTYSSHRKNGKKGYGRLTPNMGKSALSLNKQVRGFLFEDFCSDVDCKNMHPEIVVQLAELLDQPECAKLIRSYNENRELWFNQMIQANPKLNRQLCKSIGFTFLYEGSVQTRFEEFELPIPKQGDDLWLCYSTCHDACVQVKKLRDRVKTTFSDTWKELPVGADKAPNRIDASKFSTFIQHLEHVILLKLRKKCKGDAYDVNDLQHDGLFVSELGDPAVPGQEYLDECSEFILKETGFKLELTCKAFDIPDELREYTPAMNDAVDKDKVASLVPDTPEINLNNYKLSALAQYHLNQAEISLLGRLLAGKYVIRVAEKWYIVNIETGKFNHKPYGKDKYKDAVGGTALEDTHFCDEIKIYARFVFKEPSKVRHNEWNTYLKTLPYDRLDKTPLDESDHMTIGIVINHFKEQFCRNDENTFNFLIKTLQDKLANPFDLPAKPVCLILFGLEGVGKTMPIEKLFANAFGYEYISASSSFENVTNPSGFTDAMESKLVVIMNEVPDADYNHRKMYENFKALVTDRMRSSRVKYMGDREVPNTIFYVATTNNKNAFQLSQTDRRYLMLDVSGSKRNNSAYFKELASTLDEHWRLVVRYILGYDCGESDTIPDNAIRRHCKENGLSYVGQYLKWKFEEQEWDPDDSGMKISDFYAEYKIYMEDEHKRRPLKQLKFKGELTGLYHMVLEKRVGDTNRLMYIENQQEMKDTLGVEELD